MKIELKEVTVEELVEDYENNDEEGGVIGYGGKLSIRPAYQREFVYNQKEREKVIDTVRNGFPLSIMYWVKGDDGMLELMDGQQRTLSICKYLDGDFSIDGVFFHSLNRSEQERILNYKLMVYVCEGDEKEKLDWFETINIAGKPLNKQELRNALLTGPWLTDAKRRFSKTNCQAWNIAKNYMAGTPINQDYLETVLKWITDSDTDEAIKNYMSSHQNTPTAIELWNYFTNVINWVEATFPNYRSEMKGLPWGHYYNLFKDEVLDPKKLEEEIKQLMEDDDVTKKKGIYAYVLYRNEKYLNLRSFSPAMKRAAYERQNGICPICGNKFKIEDMEADHVTPWSEGGKTNAENCQMLCKECNRRKSNK